MLFFSLLFLISPAAAKKKADTASNSANPAASSDDPSAPEYQVGTKLGEAPHSTEAKYNVNKIGERGIGSGLNFYSLDKEIGLGRQLATQVETHAKIIKDPIVSEYVNRLGQTLVRNSDARVPFTIKVIDNDEINAFALPGGFFYVNSGLIMAADNEAELAGVMAHEIAHVAARHATKQMTRSQLFNMAQLPLIFVGGPVAYTLEQAAGLGMPVSFLKFSRDSEREADLLGLEYEYSSGYDPAAFVQFFEKIAKEQKQKVSFLAKAFATHPMTGDRIRLAQREIQDLLPARPEYVVDTSEFQDMKAHLATLMSTQRMHGPHGRPVLHKRERATLKTGAGGSTGSSDSSDAQTTAKHQDDDQRPTLKRDPS